MLFVVPVFDVIYSCFSALYIFLSLIMEIKQIQKLHIPVGILYIFPLLTLFIKVCYYGSHIKLVIAAYAFDFLADLAVSIKMWCRSENEKTNDILFYVMMVLFLLGRLCRIVQFGIMINSVTVEMFITPILVLIGGGAIVIMTALKASHIMRIAICVYGGVLLFEIMMASFLPNETLQVGQLLYAVSDIFLVLYKLNAFPLSIPPTLYSITYLCGQYLILSSIISQ